MPSILPNRRGSKEIVRYDFHSALTVAQQGIELVGAPPVDDGLTLDGATQYAIAHRSFELGDTWAKFVFTPNFAADDGISSWLFAGGGAWLSQDSLHMFKHSGNGLYFYAGLSYVFATLADFTAYWNVGVKNTMILYCGLGATSNRAIYLNGNKLTTTTGIAAIGQAFSDMVIGARDTYGNKFDGTIHQLIIGQDEITDLDAAKLYAGDIGEQLRSDKPLIHLPCRRIQEVDVASPNTLTDGDMEAVGTAAWFCWGLLTKQGNAAVGSQCLRVTIGGWSGELQITQTGAGFDSVAGNKYRLSGYVRSNQSAVDNGSARIWPAAYGSVLPFINLPNTTAWTYFSEEFVAATTTQTAIGGFCAAIYTQYWEFDELVFQRLDTGYSTPNVGSLGSAGDAMLGSDGRTAVEMPSLIMPKGFDYDGVDDLLTIPDNAALSFGDGAGNDSPFTIAAMIRPDAVDFSIVGKNSADAVGEYRFEAATHYGIYLIDAGGNLLGRHSTSYPVVDDVSSWVYVMATYSGSKAHSGLKVYRNGVQIDTTDSGAGYAGMTPGSLDVLTGKVSARFAEGKILEPKVWSRELSSLEASYESAEAFAELNV